MAYTPRQPFEVLATLVARAVATSRRLTDISEGGVLHSILGTVADEVASVERRVQEFVDGYFLSGTGANLDRRLADFPAGFPKRRQATTATGGAFRVERTTTSSAIVVPPGRIVARSSFKRDAAYTNTASVVFEVGQAVANGIPFRCTTPGFAGNIDQPGAIDTIDQKPADIVEVTNTLPIAGGSDRESSAALITRARRWVASLALTQREALEAVALNFQASDGTVLQHARIWTDLSMPGYSELVVDDGTGMQGYTRAANATGGVVPHIIAPGRRFRFDFDAPAAGEPQLRLNGNLVPPGQYLKQDEFGVLFMNDASTLASPGQTWSIQGHQVYTGIISELQLYLNRICIAAGTRVIVVPPIPQVVDLSAVVVVAAGQNVLDVRDIVRRSIITFVSRLPPGEPLIMYRLIGALNVLPGVVNVRFDQSDAYPGSLKHKLVATAASVALRGGA